MRRSKYSQITRGKQKRISMPKKSKFGTVAVGTKRYKHGISKAESDWCLKMGFLETSKVIYGFNGKIIIVDGWNAKTNTAGEYLGEVYHGSHRTNPTNRDVKLWIGKTPNQLYNETIARFNFLYSLGIKVFFVWESDYKKGFLGRYYKGPGDNLY